MHYVNEEPARAKTKKNKNAGRAKPWRPLKLPARKNRVAARAQTIAGGHGPLRKTKMATAGHATNNAAAIA
eukprot:8801909-Lingulodinium_polyedra.AAC.1